MAAMASLPQELLALVFRFVEDSYSALAPCALVCRDWNRAISQERTKMACAALVHLEPTNLVALLHGHSRLEVVDLTCSTNVLCDEVLAALSQHSPSLKVVSLTHIPPPAIGLRTNFTVWNPNAVKIRLRNCPNITDAGVQHMKGRCPLLSEIQLHSCSDALTDSGIMRLGDSCRKLTAVEVWGCKGVTDATMLALTRYTNLRCLRLSSCSSFTNSGLEALIRGVEELSALNLQTCDITDDGLGLLAKLCPHLTSLTLRNIRRAEWAVNASSSTLSYPAVVPMLPPSLAANLACRTSGLRELTMRSCKSISVSAVAQFVASSPALQTLTLIDEC